MLPVGVLGTGSVRPGKRISTAELIETGGLDAERAVVEKRTGITSRYWAERNVSPSSVGTSAVRLALTDAGLDASALKRLIFVNSTGGDRLIPATANAVCDALDIRDTCDCFDINNACMGFLTAFDLAARTVATGLGPVAIVTVELLSRYLNSDNPRPYLVLADAAGAVILGSARDGEGVLASVLANDGSLQGIVAMDHPGLSGKAEQIVFAGTNREISLAAVDCLEQIAHRALRESQLGLDDIDWIVPHQPNGNLLVKIVERFQIPEHRVVPVVQEIGSVGAASIPVGLDALRKTGAPGPGERVLMVGVGAGISYGAVIYQAGS